MRKPLMRQRVSELEKRVAAYQEASVKLVEYVQVLEKKIEAQQVEIQGLWLAARANTNETDRGEG